MWSEWVLWGISTTAFILTLWDRYQRCREGRRAAPRHLSAVLDTHRHRLILRNDGPLPVVIQGIALGPGPRPSFVLEAVWEDTRHQTGDLTLWPDRLPRVEMKALQTSEPFRPYKRHVDLHGVNRFMSPGAELEIPVEDHHVRHPTGVFPKGHEFRKTPDNVSLHDNEYVLGVHIPEVTLVDAEGRRWVKCEREFFQLKPDLRAPTARHSWLEQRSWFPALESWGVARLRAWHLKKTRRRALGPRFAHWLWRWRAGPVEEPSFPKGIPPAWRYSELLDHPPPAIELER